MSPIRTYWQGQTHVVGEPSLLPKASKIMCATHREVKETYPSLEQRKFYCWAESGEQSGGGSLITKSCVTLATPWTTAHQVPLFMEFSRQEYWRGLPFLVPKTLNSFMVLSTKKDAQLESCE